MRALPQWLIFVTFTMALLAPLGQANEGDNSTATPDGDPPPAAAVEPEHDYAHEPPHENATDDRYYEDHRYDEKRYDDSSYDDYRYGDGTYNEPRYPDQPYDDQRYADQPYDDQRYADQPYDDPRYRSSHSPPPGSDSAGYEGEDPCRDIFERMEADLAALHERHEAEWDEFEARHQESYNAGDGTSEGDRASHDARAEEERALHQKQQAEREETERRYHHECENKHQRHQAAQPRRADSPDYGDDPCGQLHEDTRARYENMDQRYHDEWRALEDERHAYYSEPHSPEEDKAFEADMAHKEQSLKERHEAERRALEEDSKNGCEEQHRDHMKDERDRQFEEDRRRRADEYRKASPQTSASMREMDQLRQECEGRAHERMRAFEDKMEEKRQQFEASGSDDWNEFEGQMMDDRHAFEREMHDLRTACEQKMRAYYGDHIQGDLDEGNDYERMGAWTMEETDGGIFLHGKYMSMQGDPTTNTIGNIAVSGLVYITHIDSDGYLEEFDMAEGDSGSTLTAKGDGLRLRLHDNPGGVINFKADGKEFQLTIPSTFSVEQTPAGFAWSNGDARASLRASDASWDEASNTLSFTGQATFLLPGSSDNQVLHKVANKHRTELMAAVDAQRLGAEITIAGNAEGGALDDTIVYDDVEVEVEAPTSSDKPVEITVSADSSEDGKTFVLNLDEELFDLGSKLDITYFDIDEATGAESSAKIHKASSLSDILDATDDETAEYWIVMDEDGIQVLVSVPTWSTHRFKVLASEGAADPDAPGIPAPSFALVALAAVAAAAVVSRRRD